jgi:hypothetical protein
MGSLPYNVRVNVNVPFPALVAGASGIKVTKQNGIWTIATDFTAFTSAAAVSDAVNSVILIQNLVTGMFFRVPINALSSAKTVKTLIGTGGTASPYTALPTDDVLIVNQTTGAPFTVNVDWSHRTNPLRVVDGKGDAVTNNITITPLTGQTQLASVNYSYIIDGNGGSITLTPLPNGTGAY